MSHLSRRSFLGQVGAGAMVSSVGLGATADTGLFGSLLTDLLGPDGEPLDFGALEPLVAMMQENSADALLPKLAAKLAAGTELKTLVAAAALANARTFGGQDYTGYHCFMAMIPALEMAGRLPGKRSALPVFKVLHRNTRRIVEQGGRQREVLRRVEPGAVPREAMGARVLVAGRSGDFDGGEATFAALAAQGPRAAYAALQPLVRDNIDVHQVVLAYRSWDMMRLAGEKNAHTLLRQSLRHCIDHDQRRRTQGRAEPSIRTLLPKLVDAHSLDRAIPTKRRLHDAELEELAGKIFGGSRDDAATHVASLLGEGVDRRDVGEALSLAAVSLLLHDPGRDRADTGKPKGTVHGASVGVHASDSANAWRAIAAATDPANANACLVTGAWHTAGQSGQVDPSQPHHASARDDAARVATNDLLDAVDEHIRASDQKGAAALVERYGQLGGDPEPLVARLIEPACEYDGALHHEKYFLTATQEFARSRPSSQWSHLVALARVMASGHGFEAPGLAAAKDLLGV